MDGSDGWRRARMGGRRVEVDAGREVRGGIVASCCAKGG